jgi:hypothetical protein
MASFAIHMRVFAVLFCVQNVGVAAFASLMTGKLHRAGCHLTDGCTAIMPVLSKTLWDNVVPHHQKHQEGEDK